VAVESAQARLKRIPPRACTWQGDVERSNGIIESELLEVDRWQSKSESRQRRGILVGKSTAWEYYFNCIRPNFPPTAGQIPLEVFKSRWKRGGACQQNRTPYQRMKRAGLPSKMAEQACF